MKNPSKPVITENPDGTFTIKLDTLGMQALASMVRLEMGCGWGHDDDAVYKAGGLLVDAINDAF